MLFFICLICNPREKFNSSIMLIFKFILNAKIFTKRLISETKYNILDLNLHNQDIFTFSFCKEGGVSFAILKPFSIRNVLSLSYHVLRPYFKPYKVFFSLKTWLGKLKFSKSQGCSTYTFFMIKPFKNALLTSI
jgi:hypothetical protein